MAECPRCSHLSERPDLSNPRLLRQFLAVLATEKSTGVLRERNPKSHPELASTMISLRSAIEEQWDDVFSLVFECTRCGRLLKLHADTYHGRCSWSQA
jgi:hypothetical protein